MVDLYLLIILYFFFSSRRRHTRCGRDWSSDVCSSDLDRLSFWTEKKWSKSPYLSFMNTLFYDNDNIVYEASKQISTSIDSETPFSVGRGMPEEYDYGSKPYTFTVFNDGANIKMYSPEIIINPGTIALKGSNVEFVATNEDDYNCGLQFNSVSNAFIYAADENDALVVHAFNVNNYELKVKDRNNRTIWESSGLAYDGINRIDRKSTRLNSSHVRI